jgi:hypothetical protein
MPTSSFSRLPPLACAVLLLAACAPEGGRAAEREPGERHREAERSAAAMDDTGRRPEVVGDTVVFAADRRAASDSAERELLATQPDRVLLERLLDRYAIIDFVLNELQRDTRNGGARGRAWRQERSEDRETRRIEALLDAEFNERYEPTVGSRANQVADSMLRLSPEAQNAAVEDMLLRVHRRSLGLIDSLTPRLQRPGVREGVRRLREHLAEEVADLEK